MARRGAYRLARAILDHRVVEFVYQGYRRTVEPYLLGLHEAGEPDQSFAGPRSDFNPYGHSMLDIYARA